MNITNDKVTKFIYDLYQPLNAELAGMREHAEEQKVPIILRDTETLLLNLIRIQKPNRVLEVGTAVGYSAACFATVEKGCRIISIENDDAMYDAAVENMEVLGLSERIHVLKGDAVEVMERLSTKMHVEGLAPYDFIFIDAGKSHYREFWDCAIKMVHKGSVIVCDNVLLKARTVSDEYDPEGKHKTNIKKMREFVEFLMQEDNVDTSIIPVGDGISISVVRG